MTISFGDTDERIRVGRRPRPVPDYVKSAINHAVTSGKAVTATLSESEAREAVAGFRRARKDDTSLEMRMSQQKLSDGRVRLLVEVSREPGDRGKASK